MRRQRSTVGALAFALYIGMPFALVVATACDAPTANRPVPSYDPTLLTGGVLYRWESGTTIRVWVVPNPTSRSTDLGLAVRQAMQHWNDVQQFAEYTLTMATNMSEANIVVYDQESAAPIAPGSCPFNPRSSAGYTYFCPGSGSPPRAERLTSTTAGTTRVSVIIRLDRGRVTSQDAYNSVVAHEFGHALGIGAHSDLPTDLMFGLPSVSGPSERDRATLRFLLGRPPGLLL